MCWLGQCPMILKPSVNNRITNLISRLSSGAKKIFHYSSSSIMILETFSYSGVPDMLLQLSHYSAKSGYLQLNFCSGFRWTAVLESVQLNPMTMLLRCSRFHFFGDFSAVNFAGMHWTALSNNLANRILQWISLNTAMDSTERCSGLHRWLQWNPLLAVVDSTAVF